MRRHEKAVGWDGDDDDFLAAPPANLNLADLQAMDDQDIYCDHWDTKDVMGNDNLLSSGLAIRLSLFMAFGGLTVVQDFIYHYRRFRFHIVPLQLFTRQSECPPELWNPESRPEPRLESNRPSYCSQHALLNQTYSRPHNSLCDECGWGNWTVIIRERHINLIMNRANFVQLPKSLTDTDILTFDINLLLPQTSDILEISELVTYLPLFRQQFGDLDPLVNFEKLTLGGPASPVTATVSLHPSLSVMLYPDAKLVTTREYNRGEDVAG